VDPWRRARVLWQRLAVRGVVLGVAVFSLSLAALLLRPEGATVAVWWPSAAVAIGMVLLASPAERPRLVAVVLLAGALANLAAGRPPAAAAGLGLANALETWLVAWWATRRSGGRAQLASAEDAGRLLVALLLGAGAAGGIAALAVTLAVGPPALPVLGAVTFAHASAALAAVPLLLLARPATPPGAGRGEAAAQWLATAVVTAAVFSPGQTLPLAFLPLPLLVWGASRVGARAASLQLLCTGAFAAAATLDGMGPFAAATGDVASALSLTQLLVVAYGAVLLPLGVGMQQRRNSVAGLRASEEMFRLVFEEALVGMLVLRHRPGRAPEVVRGNDVAAALLGTAPGALPGAVWAPAAAAPDAPDLVAVAAALAQPGAPAWRGQLRHVVDGEDRWVEVAVARLPGGADGGLLTAQVVDVTERRRSDARLRALALHDQLTGLPNRTLLVDRLQQALAAQARTGTGAAVLFCDLDGFKEVNDGSGHATGDALLVEVSRRLLSAVRPYDTVSRVGGDEFVVVCPGVPRAEAQALADRLLTVLAEAVPFDGLDHRVAASIGVAVSRLDSTVESLLREADDAMYAVKRATRSGEPPSREAAPSPAPTPVPARVPTPAPVPPQASGDQRARAMSTRRPSALSGVPSAR
jgi:diguanylate cyclase (GGDEF)-like protein/PAS domain S-box-containing protein